MVLLRSSVHEFRLVLPDPVDVVFDWHRRPGAFPRLAPPWHPARILQEADNLADGTAILGFPAGRRWVAQHLRAEYQSGTSFADRLVSRPFLVPVAWHHRHDFETSRDGSIVVDRVTTTLPRRLIAPVFAYRQRQLTDDLAAHRTAARKPRLTVAITGSSGLIGSAVSAFLSTGGHTVIRLVRGRPTASDERKWDPLHPDPGVLSGVDAVIHLAGQSIAGRFTDKHKALIRESRIEPTRRLAQMSAATGVKVFVCASAIGIYGADRGDERLTEDSASGEGFLSDVVRDWEHAAQQAASSSGMRVVQIRTGIVQSPRGGALRIQWPLFATGLGGPLGSADHWQSWIGIDDLIDIYHRALVDERLSGPVNAVAPHPVRQREYATALGRALHRPARLPTPSFGPRLLLGAEGARELAFADQRIVPARLAALGHRFRFPEIEPALRHLFGSTHLGD